MKQRELTPDERERKLIEAARKLLTGEISEGQLLRTLRRDALGLSQEDYARLAGVSRRTLSDMEGDKGNISFTVMNRVYRPLGFKVGLIPRQPALLEQALQPQE
ncbi:helix-turn-helix domain-containing protein [Billgrantia endophytica]|uniref:Transcriptional regulator n=1 Tax=Billgrantia endophytica TaxID=2033802 RepID=A0A2N7TX23_9GAMM|nr:helix-turn-helix domain-containing protein [Halomonas endophytica]PMR72721.1 transcriptional regulator [Halomonas endophytica]